MKILKVLEENIRGWNGKPSKSDLIVLEVEFTSGTTGKSYVDRATYDRMVFQESLIGKVVTYDDLEKFRDLCVEEEQEERSWDESMD